MPKWDELLRAFASSPAEFDYVMTSAGQDLPRAASILAETFHERWWKDKEYAASRKEHSSAMNDRTSALRLEICKYIDRLTTENKSPEFPNEVEALKNLNIDGIITTNWDKFLESLYPDYKTFIGQDELLFSNPQSIAEIYKIHGCASRHDSLVLTRKDYDDFTSKNPYLAAKLITLFVEHPIVFIGYSITDPNIQILLKGISSVLNQEKLEKLSRNLIFVQRAGGKEATYGTGLITLDGAMLPITIVTSDDFLPVYEAIDAVKRKIPAKILRYCKEQLYELVKAGTTDQKMYVVDANKIKDKNDVEFVIGIGVAADRASKVGYKGLTIFDLFENLISDGQILDARRVLEDSLPGLGKASPFVPVFKYLNELGIRSGSAYAQSKLPLDKHIPKGVIHYQNEQTLRSYEKNAKGMTAAEIIDKFEPHKAASHLTCLPPKEFDQELILIFMNDHIAKFKAGATSTAFRKLGCVYDYHIYGWKTRLPLKS